MEAATNTPTVYQGLGWFYDRYWRGLCAKAMPALDRLVLSRLPDHARILDLCCGTGHISALLARRSFRVTGLDGSEDMLRFARANAPTADFVAADVRGFCFLSCFDAVLSTFDSMNHLLSLADMKLALRNVHQALVPRGVFVFDLNMAEAFRKEWHKSSTLSERDHLCYVRGRYQKDQKLGVTEITTFRLNDNWTRQDLTIYQRCYTRADVRRALIESGFASVNTYTAKALGMRGRLSVGRVYFAASR
ncbi:MAG TPA: class I SAM-dependent methyltransferase [Bryobacteraceae bacterium]|nr:class I SAM-dependent methyltransferase [Bryobacteraceae bacterium]